MLQSEQTNELNAALAKAQAEMKAAIFNKVNPHFKSKYADLSAIFEAIRKQLAANGLSVTQTTEVREGGFVLVTTLRHASGQWVAGEYPLPIAKPQEIGSALTYARRYSLSAIAGIAADEDDDAEASRASGQVSSNPKSKPSGQVKDMPAPPKAPVAPVDPETGECSPHAITATDAVTWGGTFVAAINAAKDEAEIEAWIKNNADGLEALEGSAPKVHARAMERVAEKRRSLKAGDVGELLMAG